MNESLLGVAQTEFLAKAANSVFTGENKLKESISSFLSFWKIKTISSECEE